MNEENRLIGVSWESKSVLNNLNVVSRLNLGFLFFSEIILASLIVIGDYYVFDSLKVVVFMNEYTNISQRLIRALMDNSIHGLVGVLTWLVIAYPKVDLSELIAAGVLASIIDIDHFISAKSIKLTDAISLPNRPFLHNSLTLFILNIFLFLIFQFINSDKRYKWSILIFIAWFSHHIRDANRRGLWLGSFYTTKPIKDEWYLMIILLMPLFIRFFYQNEKNLIEFFDIKRNINNTRTHIV